MIRLYDAEQNSLLGEIDEDQLQFLMDQLEEESPSDRDYYISAETVDMLEEQGADEELVTLLREALDEREGMDIRWQRE